MKLVKFHDNWADEFNVYGFSVFTEKAYEAWLKLLPYVEYGDEFYFGTNEGISYRNHTEYLRQIEVIDLSEPEAEALIRLFPRCKSYVSAEYTDGFPSFHSYGTFINPVEHLEATKEIVALLRA